MELTEDVTFEQTDIETKSKLQDRLNTYPCADIYIYIHTHMFINTVDPNFTFIEVKCGAFWPSNKAGG